MGETAVTESKKWQSQLIAGTAFNYMVRQKYRSVHRHRYDFFSWWLLAITRIESDFRCQAKLPKLTQVGNSECMCAAVDVDMMFCHPKHHKFVEDEDKRNSIAMKYHATIHAKISKRREKKTSLVK